MTDIAFAVGGLVFAAAFIAMLLIAKRQSDAAVNREHKRINDARIASGERPISRKELG